MHGGPELTGVPTSSHDSLRRLRYAKDALGVDLSESYPHYSLSAEDEALLLNDAAPSTVIPNSYQDFNKRQSQSKKLINRYAKDGKGLDFNTSYPYCTSAMKA